MEEMIAVTMGALKAAVIHLHLIEFFVSFRPVTPEFTRLNCVQQGSISTRVSLTAFASGDIATPNGLHARLCHAFLVILFYHFLKVIHKSDSLRDFHV